MVFPYIRNSELDLPVTAVDKVVRRRLLITPRDGEIWYCVPCNRSGRTTQGKYHRLSSFIPATKLIVRHIMSSVCLEAKQIGTSVLQRMAQCKGGFFLPHYETRKRVNNYADMDKEEICCECVRTMKHSQWDDDCHSASQETEHLSRNPEIYYRVERTRHRPLLWARWIQCTPSHSFLRPTFEPNISIIIGLTVTYSKNLGIELL